MKRLLAGLALAVGLVVYLAPAVAVQPDEVLKDPVLEARARALSAELRCLVCQNQSIDDSDAPLARDLRLLLRDRLTKGDSDRQVMDFIVARYGEFVLLRPRFAPHTFILWLSAPVILLFASIGIFVAGRRRWRNPDTTPPLSAAEKRKLKMLLD